MAEFEDVGVDLLLLQCSPQLEEMERFAEAVIRPQALSQPVRSEMRYVVRKNRSRPLLAHRRRADVVVD